MTVPGPVGGTGPLLSLVLPVGEVGEYLPACLDSILGQDGPAGGVEVIAVDDAAQDASGAILDARAGQDPRLRVIHLSARVGPGPARMRGLAAAGGSYVWFVDPDDLLAPGALAAVAGRVARDRPEVLLLDYQILDSSGRARPSPWAAVLSGADGGPVTLAGRPSLINRTMTIWSKVISREFLLGLGVPFPPGIHEDVPVSCAALLAASRIVLLDRVCYLYRRRAGSFLATTGTSHFGIFSSYHQVFAFGGAGGPLAAASQSPQVRAAVFGRAIEHYASILGSGLVPPTARREFFECMARDFRRYRPAGYRRPPGMRGVKIALIGRGAYRAYLVLAPLNGARVRARRMLRALADAGPA